MLKYIGAGGLAIAALLGGALFLGYSPVACGCIDPATSLAFTAGMGVEGNPVVMDAERIEAGLNRELRGTQVEFGRFPYSDDHNCTQSSPDVIVCKVPAEESAVLTRGYRVTFYSSSGRFRKAEVVYSRWL